MINSVRNKFLEILPKITAYAHCDVPCGIYDPKSAQIAAATVVRMVEKIEELEKPECHNMPATISFHNSITRFIVTKEEHAQKCKEELLILWSDYFKPEHLDKFPDLHDKFWKTVKLCSKNKQEVNMQSAKDLVASVDEIAKIFFETKKS